jgi:[ribosomal protein S18]-alanine N-acetyltransferase
MSSQPAPRDLAGRIAFRAMRSDDVPEVLAIERATYAFPWSEGIFRDCIRVGYLCRIAELDGDTVGYGILSCGAGEAHVLNVCVRGDLRSGGIGRRMMELLLERARGAGMVHAFLEVRPSNPVAIALYESMGFTRIGLRRAYYQAAGGREDAIVYRLDLKCVAGA